MYKKRDSSSQLSSQIITYSTYIEVGWIILYPTNNESVCANLI